MSTINQRLKDQAEPSVLEVIAWAQLVHEDTMKIARGELKTDLLSVGRYSLDEREEARKIILEYGAGKPTRIVEHRGSKKAPICFETQVVSAKNPIKQLSEPEPPFVDAEFTTNDGTE